MSYMCFDKVVYVGNKFSELRSSLGFVVAPMRNETGVYVVDFGGDSYVMSERSLAPYQQSAKDDRSIEILPVRRRRSDDEE